MPDNKDNKIKIKPLKIAPGVGGSAPVENPGFISNTFGNTDFGNSKSYDNLNLSSEFITSGDYQYIRGEQQSGLGQVGLGALRAIGKAGIEFAKTPAYLYSLGEWSLDNISKGGKGETLDKALDNAWLNNLESLDNGIKEQLPVYHSYKSGKGGILDNIASTSFWSSEGADGVGYLLGMMAPGYALKSLNLASKLSKLGLGAKTAEGVELGTEILLNTSIESLAEAKGVADRLKSKGADENQIAEAAKNTFYANMALLVLPNAIMNKNLLGRFNVDKSMLNEFKDASGKLLENPIVKKTMLQDYGKTILGSAISEGLVEEGGQTSIENYEVNKALGKTNLGFIEGVANEYLNTISTTDGLKSIVLGSVLGSFGGIRGTYSERKAKQEYRDKNFSTISQLIKDNFEGFGGDNEIYDRDENGVQTQINPTKLREATEDFVKEVTESQIKDLASLNDDKILHDYLNNKTFTRAAIPFLKLGDVGLELLNDKIDKASEVLSKTEQNDSFNESKFKSEQKAKAKQLLEVYNTTMDIVSNFKSVKMLQGLEGYEEYSDKMFNAAFQEVSKQIFYKEKIQDLNNELGKFNSVIFNDLPQNQIKVKELQSQINGLTKLVEESKVKYNALENEQEQTKALFDFIKDKKAKEKELADLTKEQEAKEKSKEINEEFEAKIKTALDSNSLDEFDSIDAEFKDNSYITNDVKNQLIAKRNNLNKLITEFAKALKDGRNAELNTPEYQEFYSNNKVHIETKLAELQAKDIKTPTLSDLVGETMDLTDDSDIEAKKADIERRRNEELDKESYRIIESSEEWQDDEGRSFVIDKLKNGKQRLSVMTEMGKQVLDTYEGSVAPEKFIANGKKVKNLDVKQSKIVDKINAKYDAELAALENNQTNTVSIEDQDFVSEANKLGSVKSDDEAKVYEPIDYNEAVPKNKGIKYKVNVLMMHLFDHYFNVLNQFRFKRNEDGLPEVDNVSNININALNSLKIGDKVQLKLVEVTPELNDFYKTLENFDGKHIAIYSNNELVGFIKQPYPVSDETTNRETSKEVRETLIKYRKSVISKLENNEDVFEEITEKGTGNLYSKLDKDGYVDATYNPFDNIRDQDKIEDQLVFVYADKEGKLMLPPTDINEDTKKDLEKRLAELNKFNSKPGKIFQLVKDLTGQWYPLPIYPNSMNKVTVDAIMKYLDTVTPETDPKDIVRELQPYIYASQSKTNATLTVNNNDSVIKFSVDGVVTLLNELQVPNRRKAFIDSLMSKRQNISINDINNPSFQEKLIERGTLATNATTFYGEYFVQPYFEISFNNLAVKAKADLTQEQANDLSSTQPSTKDSTSLNDKVNEKLKNLNLNTALNDDDALSQSKDTTKLNRKAFKEYLTKNLPQLSLSDIESIYQLKDVLVDAFGMFRDSTVYLFEGAGQKTAYHEAFHGVFRNLLTVKQREDIIKEAFGKYEAPTDQYLQNLQDGLKNTYSKEQLTYLYYEEKLADDFANYVYDRVDAGFFTRIGNKILDFFKKIFNFYKIFKSNNTTTIEDIFSSVNEGKLATVTSKSNSVVNRSLFNEYAYSKQLSKNLGGVSNKAKTVRVIGDRFMALFQQNILNGTQQEPIQIFNDILKIYKEFIVSLDIDIDKARIVINTFNDESNTKTLQQLSKENNIDYPTLVKLINAGRISVNYQDIIKEVKKYLAYRNVIVNQKIEYDENLQEVFANSNPANITIDFITNLTQESNTDEEIYTLESKTVKGLGEWTSISGLSSASTRIKLFLSSIPVLKDGNQVTDEFGIPLYHDFTDLYYYIERNLIQKYELEEQIKELKVLAVNRPELNQVIDMISIKPTNMNQDQFELLQNDFKTNFSKQQLAYTLVKFNTDSASGKVTYEIIDANRESLGRETFNQWNDNLYNGIKNTIGFVDEKGEQKINITKASKLLDNWNELNKTNKLLDYSKVNDLLLQLGIEYTPDVLRKLLTENDILFKNNITTVLNWYSDENPDNLAAKGREALSKLVALEVDNLMEKYTSSFINGENKNIYTIQLPSFISKTLAKIKNSSKFKEWKSDLMKDDFYYKSNLLEMLTDINYRDIFKVSYLDSLKDAMGKKEGSTFTSLTPKDFLATQLSLFLNSAVNNQKTTKLPVNKYIYLTPSDKSMCVIVDSTSFNVELLEGERKIDASKSAPIIDKYLNIFISEAIRIKKANDIKADIIINRNKGKFKLKDLLEHYHVPKSKFNDLLKYNDKQDLSDEDIKSITELMTGKAFIFNYFSEGFSNDMLKELGDIIVNSNGKADINNKVLNNKEIRDKVVTGLTNELNKDFINTLVEFQEKGIIKYNPETKLYSSDIIDLDNNKVTEQSSRILLKTIAKFSTNTLLHNIELNNVFNGDFAQYKPGDLQKRTYQSQAMTVLGNFKDKIIKTIVVKDVESSTNTSVYETIDNIIRPFAGDTTADYIKSKYESGINVTDAQVYITPDFYKRIHVARGTWTDLKQEAFDIIQGIKEDTDKIEYNKINEKLKDKKLSEDKIKELNKQKKELSTRIFSRLRQLEGIKPYYFGNRFDSSLNMQRFEQVKCAMIPLFKEYLDINPLLKDKYDQMVAQNIDMMAHESSFKAAIGNRTDITDNNHLILDLNTDNFGIQVDNPDHMTEGNDSLRQLKMLILGSVDKNSTYNGINGKDIIDSITSMEAYNLQESLDELKDKMNIKNNVQFAHFIKDMVTKRGATINVEEILNIEDGDFEYALDSGNISTQVENMISSIFTNNAIKQSFTIGGSAVQATALGFKYKNLAEQQEEINKVELFDGFWTRKQIEEQKNKVFLFGDNTNDRLNTKYIPSSTQAVIRGLDNAIGIDTKKDRGTNNSSYFTDNDFDAFKKQVDEAINKAKDSGKIIVIPKDGIGTGKAMLKEKAPKLFEYLNNKLNDLQTMGEINLLQQELKWIKPNEETGKVEYAECAMPAWTEKFFKPDGTLLDINNIPDEVKELIAYRIPTEGLHSMLPIRVVKFLPPTMGNFILLPYEITTQFGADFDFDKVYFVGRDFYKNEQGQFEAYKYIDGNGKDAISKRYYQYTQTVPESNRMSYDTFLELPVSRQNVRDARNNEILNNYFTLLSSFNNLHLLINPSGFGVLEEFKKKYFPDYYKNNFFSSITQRDFKERNHIGIALKGQAALHVSGHSYGVLMNLETTTYNEKNELDHSKAVNIDGTRTLFNELYTDNGKLIADELASIMAAILDDIKNPLLEPLGINNNTIDVLATIIRSGVNMETALAFTSQPSIKALSSLLASNKNKIKEVNQARYDVEFMIKTYTKLTEEALANVKLEDENPIYDDYVKILSNTKDNLTTSELLDNIEMYKVNSGELQKGVKYTNENGKDKIKFKKATPLETLQYYSYQTRVLKQFANIEPISKALVKTNKFFAINKEVGPNIEDIISKKDILNEIESPKFLLKGFDLKIIPTLDITWDIHKEALTWFEQYFPYSTDVYTNIKNKIARMQFNKPLHEVKVEDRQYINNFIRTFMDYEVFNVSDSKIYDELLFKLPDLIINIKSAENATNKYNNSPLSYETIKNNPFIKQLKVNFDKSNKGVKYIQLKGNRLDLQVKNNVIEGFTALYNNQHTQKLAIDLLKHSFLTTGFFKGIRSYSSLISPEILKSLGYNKFRKEKIRKLKENKVSLSSNEEYNMIDQMIRNNPRTFSKTFDQEIFGVSKEKALPKMLYTNIGLVKESGRSSELMFISYDELGNQIIDNPYVITVYDKFSKKPEIYSLVDEFTWEKTTPLGKNGNLIEINTEDYISKSYLNDNNSSDEVIEEEAQPVFNTPEVETETNPFVVTNKNIEDVKEINEVEILYAEFKDRIIAKNPNVTIEDLQKVADKNGIEWLKDYLKKCY